MLTICSFINCDANISSRDNIFIQVHILLDLVYRNLEQNVHVSNRQFNVDFKQQSAKTTLLPWSPTRTFIMACVCVCVNTTN